MCSMLKQKLSPYVWTCASNPLDHYVYYADSVDPEDLIYHEQSRDNH